MILVDTNILIDIASPGSHWAAWSREQLILARLAGVVAVNEVAFTEFCAGFDALSSAERFLEASGVELASTPRPALFAAGQVFRRYRRDDQERKTGVLPDFFIGAHAQALGCPLITRDVRRYRTYFPDVRLITP